MKAKINLTDAVIIKGRGLVLVGQILEGDFMTGDVAHFSLEGEEFALTIKGIELINIRNQIQDPSLLAFRVIADTDLQQKIRNYPALPNTIAEIH